MQAERDEVAGRYDLLREQAASADRAARSGRPAGRWAGGHCAEAAEGRAHLDGQRRSRRAAVIPGV